MSRQERPAESRLFAPCRLGGLTLANRMVMAPMSRNRAGADGAAHALTATYYAQRASAGLIVTEAAPIAPGARTVSRAPGIYTARQVEGWRMVTQAVHAAGGRILLQLWHAGRVSQPSVQPDGGPPVAPSAMAPPGGIDSATGLVRSSRRGRWKRAKLPQSLRNLRKLHAMRKRLASTVSNYTPPMAI